MTVEARAVLEQALRLDAVQRAELIEALFRSFETTGVGPHDAAWVSEAESRVDAYEAGKLGAAPAEEILDRIAKQ